LLYYVRAKQLNEEKNQPIILFYSNLRSALFIYTLFFATVSYSQKNSEELIVDVNTIGNDELIGKNISFFEENGRSLTIGEVIDKPFTSSENEVLNFGYSSKAVWLKFNLKNTQKTLQKIVSIQKPLQDTVQFFYKDSEHWKKSESGQMISESQKELPGFSISFPVHLKENSTNTFYIRAVSKYGKTFAIRLLSESKYLKNEKRELIISCILIGILITILIYNFFLARSLKDHIYDFYCLTVLGSLSLQLVFRGFFKLYFLDNSPFLQEWAPIFIFCATTIFSSYFCIRFLNTKKYSKAADWALKGIIILKVIAFLYPFISFEVFGVYTDSRLLGYFAILFSFVAICSGIIVYRKGNKSARFLIYAWSVLYIAVVLYSLASLAVIPANVVTMNAYMVGSVLEVFLLSLALGDRYIQLKKERIRLRKEIALKEQTLFHKNAEISTLKLETLQYIKSKQHLTEELKKISKAQEGITLKEVLVNLQADKISDTKLEVLKKDIDALNIDQMTRLKIKFPELTKGEMELASFLLLGLTRKEIATLRNTSYEAVRKNIYRFRKKIGIEAGVSFENFVSSLKEI